MPNFSNIIRSIAFLFAIMLFSVHKLEAQQTIQFSHINIDQGLSHNSVQCILQDQQGFLWFGTEDGLNRYDGYEFKVFRPSEDTNSISGLFIWDLRQDREGNIWIGTNYGGLCVYNSQNGRFKTYRNIPGDSLSLGSDYVRSVLVDNQNNVWVGTYGGGLNLLDKETGNFKIFKHREGIPGTLKNNVVGSLFQDKKGRLWVGTEGGLHLFNPVDSSFTSFENEPGNKKSISHNQIDAILEDTTGVLWVGTKNGLNKLDETTGSFERYMANETKENALSHNLITSLFLDREGLIWIGTDGGGISLFDPYKNTFNKILNDPENPNSLRINLVRTVFQDQLGIYWVATNGGGICKYMPYSEKFTHEKYEPYNPDGLNHNVIRSFFMDTQDRLWIGTVGGGINIKDPVAGKYYKIQHNPAQWPTLSSNVVISIYKQDDYTLWAGTWEAGLNRVKFRAPVPAGADPNDYISSIDQIFHKAGNPSTISSDIVQAILKDKQGFMWFGTGSGLDIYDESRKQFINISNRPGDSASLSDNRVQSALAQDRNGDIWVGTWNGLNRMKYPKDLKKNASLSNFMPEAVQFEQILHSESDRSTLSDNRVISLYIDNTSPELTVWAGTYGGGLNKIVVHDAPVSGIAYTITRYSKRSGLGSDVIYAIHPDSRGNLWMSTNDGIMMFNPQTLVFRNYNESEGVQSSQFYWGSGLKDRNGYIYLGGVNGYNVFHADSIQNKSIPPRVLITDVKIFNESVPVGVKREGKITLHKAVNFADHIELNYHENVVSFEFAVLHYIAPYLNQHAYMLEGIDKEWNYISNRRFVTYTNLPPGEYLFKVKGANNEGVWSEEMATLKVIVKPPYWKTWWFRILVIGLILLIVVTVYRLRVHAMELRNRYLETMVQRKTKDLKHEIEERKSIEESLRTSEQKLMELNANKDKFFKIIAHDLRNPINVTLGFSELLTKNYQGYDDEKRIRFIESIFQATSNINNLLENLLQWSMAQSGRISVRPVEVNLHELIRTNLIILEENLDQKEITAEVSVSPSQLVLVDHDMLETIVRNLLTNAIKFTPKGGKISITTIESINNHIDICFSDSGVGMTPEQVDNLFKMELSSSSRGTEGEKGTGLGLMLCREFIEKNKGKIWVESQVDAGTRFYIRLPLPALN